MDIVNKAIRNAPIQSQTSAVTTQSFRGIKNHPSLSGVQVPDHVYNNPKTKQRVVQNPTSQVSPDMLNGGTVDIRIEKGAIDLVTSALLKVSLTNDTGASATIAPSPFLINKIDIFAGNGANLLATVYGQELWLSLACLSQQEFEQIVSLLGTSVAYVTTGTAMADTTTRDFYIPLYTIFSQASLHLAGLKGELLLKVYFNTVTLTHLAGSLVNCDAIQLILQGYKELAETKQKRMNLYSGKYIIPFISNQRFTQTVTLAASSTYNFTLSNFRGMSAGIFVTIRAAAITAANQGSYLTEFDYVDVQNSDGSSMIGFYKKRAAERVLDYIEIFNNRFGNNSNFLFIPFSSNPMADFITGSNNGFEVFTGFEKLVFTTPSTTAGASYVIDVYSLSHQQLVIQGNSVIATQ